MESRFSDTLIDEKDPLQTGTNGHADAGANPRETSDQARPAKGSRSELSETEDDTGRPSSVSTRQRGGDTGCDANAYWQARKDHCRANRRRMGGAHLGGLSHRTEDRVPDQFRDFGDNGVPECIKAVHVIGKPINNSDKLGSNFVVVCCSSPRARATQCPSPYEPPPFLRAPLPFVPSQARGVGNSEPTVTFVGVAKGGSGYTVPPRIKPDLGQVSENAVEPPSKDSCDVLQQEPIGSKLISDSDDLAPKAATFSFDASASASMTDVLAWEACCRDTAGNPIGSKPNSVDISDIVVDPRVRPVLGKNQPLKGLLLDHGDGLEPARALQAEREATDAAEKIENAELLHLPALQSADRIAGAHVSRSEEGDGNVFRALPFLAKLAHELASSLNALVVVGDVGDLLRGHAASDTSELMHSVEPISTPRI